MDEPELAADYSSATLISAKALKEDGSPLTSQRLNFYMVPAQEDADGGIVPTGDRVEIGDALTDATGTATIACPGAALHGTF